MESWGQNRVGRSLLVRCTPKMGALICGVSKNGLNVEGAEAKAEKTSDLGIAWEPCINLV